jgi:hypothetical protein
MHTSVAEDDSAIAEAASTAKAEKAEAEAARKMAATAKTIAFVMVDIETCSSERGQHAVGDVVQIAASARTPA